MEGFQSQDKKSKTDVEVADEDSTIVTEFALLSVLCADQHAHVIQKKQRRLWDSEEPW